jgi:hypothetical protein
MQERLKQLLERNRSQLYPETLYHYTSIDGFYNMVKNKSIWASQIQYLNDSKEFLLTSDIIDKLISRYKAQTKPEGEVRLLNKIQSYLKGMEGLRMFIFSLSEEGDLLSQWRAYCPSGGVSIGFDPTILYRIAQYQGYNLNRCIYKPSEQEQEIADMLTAALEEYESDKNKKEESQLIDDIIRKTMWGMYLEIAALLKHDSFYEEREWRLRTFHPKEYMPSTRWRVRGNELIPYDVLNLDVDNMKEFLTIGTELPFTEIIIGPSQHQRLLEASINSFLSSLKIMIPVYASRIPYRSA